MARSPRGKSTSTPDDDAALFAALGALLAAEKTLSSPIAWVEDEPGNLRFNRALDIDGVTEASFILFGRAVASLPDRHVVLGLRWADAMGRGGHFDRLDWKPMDAHNNKGLGPPEFRHVVVEGTHHHRLADNAALAMGLAQAMRENLPVAVPVEPEPDWPDFLAEAARRWRIHDLVNTPVPPWQYDLLTLPSGNRGDGQ
jgi:hypothetical protein